MYGLPSSDTMTNYVYSSSGYGSRIYRCTSGSCLAVRRRLPVPAAPALFAVSVYNVLEYVTVTRRVLLSDLFLFIYFKGNVMCLYVTDRNCIRIV
jgi:hypothetical protein